MTAASPDLSEFDTQAAATAEATKRKTWWDKLTGDQQEKVLAAYAAGYSGPVIAKVVNGWGITVCPSSINIHRRDLRY